MKNNQTIPGPGSRLTKIRLQLLHWISRLELSGGIAGEQDVGRLLLSPALKGSLKEKEKIKVKTKNSIKMKSKHQILKWMAMLVILFGSVTGAWAQVGTLTLPGDETVCFNSTHNYGVVANPTSGYQWTIIPGSGGAGTMTAGASQNLMNVTWITSGTCTLRVIELNANSCTSEPVDILISVLPELLPGTASANQTISYNGTPTLLSSTAPTGGTGTYSYQWETNATGTWAVIPGANALTYQPGPLTATTSYRLQQTSETCGTVTSNEVTITVLPQLTAPVIAAGQTICSGLAPAEITMPTAPTGGNGTYTYQWETNASVTWAAIPGATRTAHTPGALTATTSYRLVATATGAQNGGLVPNSNEVQITVNPLPVTSPIYHD